MKTQPPEYWLSEFRSRMDEFALNSPTQTIPISIKLRVESGCFCRSCCSQGHQIIADYLRLHPDLQKEARIVEHESGPEILTYINLAAGVSSLAAGVISLIVAIIQARSEGINRGDKQGHPFKLIVRRMDEGREFKEEIIMEIPPRTDVNFEELASRLLTHANQVKAISKSNKTAKRKKKGK